MRESQGIMPPHLGTGFLLVLLAGVAAGNCMTPLKRTRHWGWENTWLVFSLVSLVLIPWALALGTIPDVWGVYSGALRSDLLLPLSLGFGWGIAQVLFGISVVRLGLALGFAIILGLGGMLGTLVPVMVQRPEVLTTSRGGLLLAGTAVMLLGVAVCGYAGRQREMAETAGAHRPKSVYTGALVLAIVCGVMAPMLNFGLAFGGGLERQAVRYGAAPANAPFAVWPIVLAGGLIPNAAYAVYLLNRNRTWSRFGRVWPDVGLSALMGLLWMGAVATYGLATRYLGALGTSAGWGLFQILMIVAANVSGLVTGEWAKAGSRALRILLSGLALLAIATALMAAANR